MLILHWNGYFSSPNLRCSIFLPSTKLPILFISPLPLLGICLLLTFCMLPPLGSLFLNNPQFVWLGQLLYVVVPAFITPCTLLLLIDNFTYTLFEYAVFTNTAFNCAIYTALFAYLLYASSKQLMKLISHPWIYIAQTSLCFINNNRFVFNIILRRYCINKSERKSSYQRFSFV